MDIVQKEYENDAKLKREDVKMLQDWLVGQPHLPKMTEHEIIWFLKSCYYSNEAAKITIDNYFTMKTLSPEVLRNRDVHSKEIQQSLDVITYTILPKRTPEGYTVLIGRLMDTNPERWSFNDCIKCIDMVILSDLHNNVTQNGLRCCVDMKGVVFGHITRIGIVSLKKFLIYLQEGMPVRLKGIHFFNATSVMDKLLFLMKPFLKKEVLEMLHVHESVQDMVKFVPMECLPSDYGGKYDSYDVIRDRVKKNVMEHAEFFAYQDSQLVDESKRPGKPKNASDIFGVEGTFKKLDID